MSKIDELIKEFCPQGVKFVDLHLVCEIQKGEQLNRARLSDSAPYPVINGGISPSGYHTEYNYDGPALTISQGGASAGYVSWINSNIWAGAHCYVLRPDSNQCNLRFLYFVLKQMQDQINRLREGAGIPGLGLGKLKYLKIPVPPIQIQLEIVSILDAFTELEAELEAELGARRKQYRYYLDALFTHPLKGVQWLPMGEVGEFVRGKGIQKSDFTEEGVPCIHYGQVFTQFGTSATGVNTYVNEFLGKQSRFAEKGDLVIATTSENINDVCKAVAWLGEEPVAVSGDAMIYKHQLDPLFVTYFFQTSFFQFEKNRKVSGTKVMRVSSSDLAKIQIPVPSLDQQREIGFQLQLLDDLISSNNAGLPAELAARRKQYEYYRDILLTFKELAA